MWSSLAAALLYLTVKMTLSAEFHQSRGFADIGCELERDQSGNQEGTWAKAKC